MAQLSPQKRKKRRVQLREAQRRRRARLKEDSKSFLQIILSQETLSALRNYSEAVGKPLHTSAADLIDQGLQREERLKQPDPLSHSPDRTMEGFNGMRTEAVSAGEPSEHSEDQEANQLDLFK